MSAIQIIQVSPEQLLQQINDGVKVQLDALVARLESKQPDDYLTRKDVAGIFKVNLSTINNWTKAGKRLIINIGMNIFLLQM
jgi:hypothetical protein